MQLMLTPQPPDEVKVISVPDYKTGYGSKLWFRWKGDWVRDEWCGKFPDGTPRPPWYDDLFMHIWDTEGPDAARDKNRYDLNLDIFLLTHSSA